MDISQQKTQDNIGKADAVHDLGQSGRVRRDDLPLCRLALGDMLKDINTPTVYTPKKDCIKHMNEGLSIITGGLVTSTGRDREGESYERQYAKSIFSDGYETIYFQDILKGYFEWKDAGKPGERPFGWLKYTGFRSQESKKSDTPKLWEKGKDARNIPVGATQLQIEPTSKYGSLEISWDFKSNTTYKEWDMYDERNKRIICDFITKYLYPGRKTIDKGVFVFDANAGSIKELFDSLDQISSEINPMVLADSAGTSMSQLGKKGSGRNAFCFPINKENAFQTSANIHTATFGPDTRFSTEFFFKKKNDDSDVPLQYTKQTYNTFVFRFVIYVKDVTGQIDKKEWDIEFTSSGPSSGPSVPYLGKVIAAIRRAYYANSNNTENMIKNFTELNPRPLLASIMDITNQIIDMMKFLHESNMTTSHICLFIERLAMDVKKCGDWEQIQSVKTSMNTCPTKIGTAMLCTGDYLCAAKARLEGVNGVWHNEDQGGATGWKLQLFRSPDLSDPNMAVSINIVDNARRVLPLLYLASKKGVFEMFKRLTELRDITAYAVQFLKEKIGDPPPDVVGQEAKMADPTMFPDIFSTICLANVSSTASKRLDILQNLVNLRETLDKLHKQYGDTYNIITIITKAKSAITDFQIYNSNSRLQDYITNYSTDFPGIKIIEEYSTDFNTWKTINGQYAFLQSAIIGVLIELKFPVNIVNSLTTSDGDISEDNIRDNICSPDATVLILKSDQVNGELIVNPYFICGKAFHYDYKSMIEVSAKQSAIHMKLEQLKSLMDTLQTTVYNLANDAAMHNDYSFAKIKIGTDFNAVIAILVGYMDDTANNKDYKKNVASTTNFHDIDIARLVKDALLMSIKIPKKLEKRWSHKVVKDIHDKYEALCETVDLFKNLASNTTNILLKQVLPMFYDKLGFSVFAGGSQVGGLGGPTNIADPNNVDLREQQALTTYFDSVISTVIGYCRNVTSQITDTNLSANEYIQKLASFREKNTSAFDLARAAFIKGLLVHQPHPTYIRLVYGPPTRNLDTLMRMFRTKIITQLMSLFNIVDNNNIPIFYLPALDPTIQNDRWKMITEDSLENLARNPYLPDRPDPDTILNTLIYATLIGDIWGSSLQDTFKNAYDNLYISNLNPSLPDTETVFNANPIDYDWLMTLPYVARCVTEQILIFPPQAGETIETGKYSSVQFLKSPLTEIIFEKGSMARWASMGRFDLWSELEKDHVSMEDHDVSMEDDDVSMEDHDGAGAYPKFTTEIQFANDVLTDLYNASAAFLYNTVDDIDTAKLAFGIANIPNSYYGSDISIVSSKIITQAQLECHAFLAQSYQEAEQFNAEYAQQLKEQQATQIVQHNRDIFKQLINFAKAFLKGGFVLPQSLNNNAINANIFLNMSDNELLKNAPQFATQFTSVGAGRKRTKKRKQRPRKTRRRKTRARTARGKIIKKKSTRRNKKRPIKTRSKH